MTTHRNLPLWQMMVFLIAIGMFSGCASFYQDLEDQISRMRFESDHDALATALADFKQGDFNNALVGFKTLATTSASKRISRRARLGELCCNLILADTKDQYAIATRKWYAFVNSVQGEHAQWDLALFEPLIVRFAPSSPAQIIVHLPPADDSPTDKETTQDMLSDDPQEKEALEKLKAKAKHADKLQLQLNKIAAENQTLKEKIKALEAIDQNIQKKKTKISAPGE